MKIGILFPGQGAQLVGMGKAFYDAERSVQEAFEKASHCLERNFVRLCFAAPEAELLRTENAQTAVFLIGSAFYELLTDKLEIAPTLIAGHSSGEYTALHAAGGINFADGLYLLSKRARFMDEVTRKYPGGMRAVIGLTSDQVTRICSQYDKPDSYDQVVQVSNINEERQVVISGRESTLDLVSQDIERARGRVIRLNVDGPFHSRLMIEAEKEFSRYLVKVDLSPLQVPMVTNVGARNITKSSQVKDELTHQMSSPVQWFASMQHFADCDLLIQVGPGKTLARIAERIFPDKKIIALNGPADMRAILHYYDQFMARNAV